MCYMKQMLCKFDGMCDDDYKKMFDNVMRDV